MGQTSERREGRQGMMQPGNNGVCKVPGRGEEEGKVKPGRERGRAVDGPEEIPGDGEGRRRAFEKNGKKTFGRRGHVLTLKFAA